MTVDHSTREKEDKRRFWEHILTRLYGTSDLSDEKDPRRIETEAFFLALDLAFTNSGKVRGIIPVDRQLVQYLAGWGRNTIRANAMLGGNPLDPENHFASRTFDGLIQTIRHAVKLNLIWSHKGENRFGCLDVPQWIVDKYMDEAREEAEHMNSMCDKFPGFSQHVSIS